MNTPLSEAARCPVAHDAQAHPVPGPHGCPVSARAAAFNPFGPAYMQAPAEHLRWAREEEPVFFSPALGYYVVTRYEDVKAVFRDHLLFSPANALEKITPATPEVMAILQGFGFAMNRTMVNEDEPDHMARRRLLMEAFLPERLLGFEPMVRAMARQAMDRFIDRGRADLVADLFYEIPLTVALRFLGVPDAGAAQLREFAVAHTLNTWGRPTHEEQLDIARQVGRFWQTAQKILDDMLAHPEGEGWMYESIRAHHRHPDIVTESYLRSMMMAILAAAHETTSNASANALQTLLSHPEAWQAICENPDLIPNAVEECLRVAGSIIAWRRVATADAVVGGVAIPAGSKLLLVQASANFDAAHFENPEQVDVYRDSAVEHLSFGYGAHQCMGKNIGRMQMRVFLEEFTRRLPHMQLVPGQTFDYLPNTSFRGPAQLWVQWDPAQNPERVASAHRPSAGPFYIGPPARDRITRQVVLAARTRVGPSLYRLDLALPSGAELPAWTAGSHIDLIAGGHRRKYSLCGPSHDRHHWTVVIQREEDGRGGSRHFCDALQVGERLQVAGPKNLFALDEDADFSLLIAAGIGITPLIAMADRLRQQGRPYALHYAGRSRAHMAWLERLQAEHGASLHLHVKSEGQRMDLSTLVRQAPPGSTLHACGPDRLIHELQNLCAQGPRLRVEHFSAGAGHLDPTREHGFVAVLRDSGLTVPVPPERSLLQALQAAGIDLPCDCGEGLCGTCEVQVLEGDIDHRDKVLSPAERATGQRMLACCSRARGERIVLGL